ncbi:MAG: S9 family peptidase, partial [Flavobacteriaceae bacterium]|nr:S9 family peptidase [Flavobacteriaceae bacterium]
PFDNETYTAYVGTNPDFDSEILRFGYNSMTTPASVYDYNMATRSKELLKQQEVLGGNFKEDNYASQRVWATAKDGVKVPISLVYRKDTPLDGSSPLLQYGYGSYGHTSDPYFSTVRLSLLDRGFVYAIAHIRGGEYLGRPWYDDGKLLSKRNTFTDFIACSEFLISEKFTAAKGLFAYGGSAGGLLMGAVMNMAPHLYKGIIASVPFVDVVTTMLDSSIPLTTGEYDEWGNPNEENYYNYMMSYSPYDNVKPQDYPNTLVITGYHDSQVQYWEPAKWVAKLRDLKTDHNILLFNTNMEAGHSGASGRFEALKEVAKEYAFILDLAQKI